MDGEAGRGWYQAETHNQNIHRYCLFNCEPLNLFTVLNSDDSIFMILFRDDFLGGNMYLSFLSFLVLGWLFVVRMHIQAGQSFVQQTPSLHFVDSHNVCTEYFFFHFICYMKLLFFLERTISSESHITLQLSFALPWNYSCEVPCLICFSYLFSFSVSIFACEISVSSSGIFLWPFLRKFYLVPFSHLVANKLFSVENVRFSATLIWI